MIILCDYTSVVYCIVYPCWHRLIHSIHPSFAYLLSCSDRSPLQSVPCLPLLTPLSTAHSACSFFPHLYKSPPPTPLPSPFFTSSLVPSCSSRCYKRSPVQVPHSLRIPYNPSSHHHHSFSLKRPPPLPHEFYPHSSTTENLKTIPLTYPLPYHIQRALNIFIS